MLKYDNKNWFTFLLRYGGNHVQGMLWSVFTLGLITTLLVILEERVSWFYIEVPAAFHTVLGLVLGLLLVFRTNSAYDRWWEGRKQLGLLVNTTRNLAIKIHTYVQQKDYADKGHLLSLIPAFVYTMKEHLRKEHFEHVREIVPASLLSTYDKAEHKPNYLLAEMAKHIKELYAQKHISGEQLIVLEKETTLLINILGACERIRNTPIPMAYALHLKRVLLVYSITLPFGFVGELSWAAIPVVMIVFYTMVGIELIGEEIEDPFGLDDNDLPVDELSKKIKKNIEEIQTWGDQ